MCGRYCLSDTCGSLTEMNRHSRSTGAMHVVARTQRSCEREYSTTLPRRSFREGGKVKIKRETRATLSHLPAEAIRRTLRAEALLSAGRAFEMKRSLPASHLYAAIVTAGRLGLPRLLNRASCHARLDSRSDLQILL
jgi:hypothetical protein